MVEHGDIRVVHRGGSKINFREPVITNDSRFLLCASGECVKVFSTSTEECIHDLRGHTDLVTGVLLKPSNHLQVYSCSADGTVRLWDFTDGILIKTYVIGCPIYSIYASANHEGVIFIVTSTSDKRSELFQLVAVHLPQSGDQLVEARELSAVLGDVSSNPAATDFGRGGEYIASAAGSQLQVYFFKKQKAYRFSLKEDNKKGGKNTFTCISCHPKDDCIATGHEDGKIRLWRNFNQKKEYTYSTLHWHHNAVSSLCFTPEGTNLLSGGIESVLVQWRYNQESQRDFLPRLGAAITHIAVSPDGALYCTSHSDNKITLIQSCVKVSAVIQGLVKGDSVRTELMVDPRSKSLVLNGKPGHLQFYSLQRDKLLYNLDIVQQEYIHESGLQQFEVVKAAFDGSGSCLATVEERKQKVSELELNLKLWAFDEQTQSFVLNTTISAPHDDRITAMCFSHTTDSQTTMLVSTSKDGHFKAWQLAGPAHTEDEGPSWSCDFVGAYHSLVPECCCFSADGSLLAVSFQEVVTVWSSTSWELLTTLSQPPGAIRNLCFGRLSCSKYLLGTTANNLLCCWNLLTCSLEWSTSMDVSLLLADQLSENMAAFCGQAGNTDLFVFKPSEPRPLFSQKAVCSGKVTRAVFAPREEMLESCEESSQWLNRSQLYFITQYMDLMTFTTKAEEDRLMASSKQLVIDDSVAMTPFYLLLGKHRQQENEDTPSSLSAERTALPQGSAAIRELLQTPAHVLPSTSFLCSMFVRSLLISVKDTREENKQAEEEMESEKEEEDSEEEMESSISKPKESVGVNAAESAAPPLTKAQLRELRRVKKLDHSWLSGLLDP
ncbi:WD repeat-containing protein 75 isoform X2 [Notolabrus celidotus]|uniref:WD repeat-containing protein 75 isoform X2 n=1 Tax=Notolabrus celidotus TaxID=1203425 RepID=UPI00149048D4|nr:WD repeat-containing protein 75 isoform X2 [Notolabrus celidotus]